MFNEGDVLYKQQKKAKQARNRPKDFLHTNRNKRKKLSARAICRFKNLKMQKTNKKIIKEKKTVIT